MAACSHTDATSCLFAWQSVRFISNGLIQNATIVWPWGLGNQLSADKLLLLAERRNALSSLDYALASGADSAANTRTEVDASMKRTAEEVNLSSCLNVP